MQHNVQNEGGGIKGFLNNVQKTADLVADGTPYFVHSDVMIGSDGRRHVMVKGHV